MGKVWVAVWWREVRGDREGVSPAEAQVSGLTQTVLARKLRVEYPEAIYHVMNRGDRREPIFKDDLDRQRFLVTLGEARDKTGWQVHAYCLMENHFHLVVETPRHRKGLRTLRANQGRSSAEIK